MEHYLNKNIKEVILAFPETADILNEAGISCASCNVGTCRLKDVVDVHNLPLDEEQTLMTRIARVIYPDREAEVPRIKRKIPAAGGEIKYSPPLRNLVDEHTVIKRLLVLVPRILEDLDIARENDRKLVLDLIDFIRSYADRYHHAKEEDILFKVLDEDLEILKSMHEEHRAGRGHVQAVLDALEAGNNQEVRDHLTAYGQLLTGHIKKEDEILYPWIDRNLSVSKVGVLFTRFTEIDKKFSDTASRQKEFIRSLEEIFNGEEVINNV